MRLCTWRMHQNFDLINYKGCLDLNFIYYISDGAFFEMKTALLKNTLPNSLNDGLAQCFSPPETFSLLTLISYGEPVPNYWRSVTKRPFFSPIAVTVAIND